VREESEQRMACLTKKRKKGDGRQYELPLGDSLMNYPKNSVSPETELI
jgi:hypothetical protein